MNHIPESPERFAFERILEIATQKHEDHDGHDLCALCLIQGWAISALEGKLAAPRIESPPECEALLAEALETLARIPIEGNINDIGHWYRERAFPTLELLDAYFRRGAESHEAVWEWHLQCADCLHFWDHPYFALCPKCDSGRVKVRAVTPST